MGQVSFGIILLKSVMIINAMVGCIFGHNSVGFELDSSNYNVLNFMDYISESNTHTSSFDNQTMAVVLDDTVQHIALPDKIVNQALHILSTSKEFTFLATLYQEKDNSGSILSFSSGLIRFLEIESRGDEIKFYYTHDQQIQVETFPYSLANKQWHRLAISLDKNDHLIVYVDCIKLYERVINTVDRAFFSGKLSLYVGQRNTGRHHSFFRGMLQDVMLVSDAYGYLLQCTDENTGCSKCAQYNFMEQKLEDMYILYSNVTSKLQKAEKYIERLEECDCVKKTCYFNGTSFQDGEVWKKDRCVLCSCQKGSVHCKTLECPVIKCRNATPRPDQCCPVCFMNCLYGNQYFEHGEHFQPRVCVNCTCINGRPICHKIDPEKSCDGLNCSESNRLQVQGECCPVCKGTNFCAKGHDCHINATCVNLATKYVCQCHTGFQGDGRHCGDINECLKEGGKTGHYCGRRRICLNTIGSYKCLCPNGDEEKEFKCEKTTNGASEQTLFTLCLCLFCTIFSKNFNSVLNYIM